MTTDFKIEHFQDRTTALEAFDKAWDTPKWMLAFDGFSGNGKSTLLWYLQEKHCDPQNIPHAKWDFEPRAQDSTISDLTEITQSANYQFDQIITRLLRGMREKLDSTAYQTFRDKRETILQELAVTVEQITVTQTQKEGQENTQTANFNLAEAKRNAERIARNRLTEAALDCLGTFTGDKLVWFFDTFEHFQEHAASDEQTWFLEKWLTEAHEEINKLRVVIGSRKEVKFSGQYTDQKPLENFIETDSDKLLENMGVTDADFRKAVYEKLAKGHPGVTHFAGQAWLEAEKSGQPLSAAAVPAISKLENAVAWIQEKIIDRLQEPIKSAVRWMPLLRRFNLDVLRATLPPEVGELTRDDFERLCNYTFVQKSGNYWVAHDLLRGVQIGKERDTSQDDFHAFHERAHSYWGSQEDGIEMLYHHFFIHFFIDKDEAFELCHGAIAFTRNRYFYETAGQLFTVVESDEIFPTLTPKQQAEVHLEHGQVHYFLGENDSARFHFNSARHLYEAVSDQRGVAHTYHSLGDLEQALGNMETARGNYGAALPLYEQVSDPHGMAHTYHSLGDLEQALGNMETARQQYDAALPLFEQVGDPQGKANTYLSLGDLERLSSNRETARGNYDAALLLYEQVSDPHGMAHTYRSLGDLERVLDNMEVARKQYDAALRLFETVGTPLGKAHTLKSLGDLETMLGNMEVARKQYDVALRLFEAAGYQRGKANTYRSLGDLERALGNMEVARKQYDAALRLFETVREPYGKANTYRSLGDLERALGNMEVARKQYDAALPLYEQVGNITGQMSVWLSHARLERQLNHFAEAEKAYKQAFQLAEGTVFESHKVNLDAQQEYRQLEQLQGLLRFFLSGISVEKMKEVLVRLDADTLELAQTLAKHEIEKIQRVLALVDKVKDTITDADKESIQRKQLQDILIQGLRMFLSADTDEQATAILQQSPELLLSDDAWEMLGYFDGDDEETKQRIIQRKALWQSVKGG